MEERKKLYILVSNVFPAFGIQGPAFSFSCDPTNYVATYSTGEIYGGALPAAESQWGLRLSKGRPGTLHITHTPQMIYCSRNKCESDPFGLGITHRKSVNASHFPKWKPITRFSFLQRLVAIHENLFPPVPESWMDYISQTPVQWCVVMWLRSGQWYVSDVSIPPGAYQTPLGTLLHAFSFQVTEDLEATCWIWQSQYQSRTLQLQGPEPYWSLPF